MATCKARAKQKVSAHGFFVSYILMALRFIMHSSSSCPPLRKTIAGTATGTVLCNVVTVYSAIICETIINLTYHTFFIPNTHETFWPDRFTVAITFVLPQEQMFPSQMGHQFEMFNKNKRERYVCLRVYFILLKYVKYLR